MILMILQTLIFDVQGAECTSTANSVTWIDAHDKFPDYQIVENPKCKDCTKLLKKGEIRCELCTRATL